MHFQRSWIFKTEFKDFQGFLKHAMNPDIHEEQKIYYSVV